MIEVLFTIDYEIYGNGEGSLKDLVYEPTRQLMGIFDKFDAKLVVFTEAAEFEKIAAHASDAYIGEVEDQIRELHEQGHEIALHLHPQWFRAEYRDGRWCLDNREYNLCNLPEERITEIIGQSIGYLRSVLKDSDFSPFSFRAGNWLFQPTATAAAILSRHGIKVDSSVFKGGRQHKHGLDYRPAIKNGDWWLFKNDVNVPDPTGLMLEIPIYTRMVPVWEMVTPKRIGLQQKSDATGKTPVMDRFYRLLDRARFRHPLKFDFCRMTFGELSSMVEQAIGEDKKTPTLLKPMVAIGHTKDLVDINTVELFLGYLKQNGINVSTFKDIFPRCLPST